jgi:hypothetical protein
MRLHNVLGATLAFTYIFYSLAEQAPRSVRPARAGRHRQASVPSTAPIPKRAASLPTSTALPQRRQAEEDRWFDSTAEFRAALAERLQELAPDKATQLLRRYASEYELFDAQLTAILKEQDSSYYYDYAKEKVVFRDKKKYKLLNEKISAMEQEYSSKVEAIFADLYPAVLDVKAEFEEEMQVYNRHEHRVGISL